MIRFVTLDLQETFDLAVHYFRTTKRQARGPYGCTYLNRGTGERCVGGYMMVAETGQDLMNMSNAMGGVEVIAPLLQIDTTVGHCKLLSELQGLHDTMHFWDDSGFTRWELMYDIALTFGLSVAMLAPDLERSPS